MNNLLAQLANPAVTLPSGENGLNAINKVIGTGLSLAFMLGCVIFLFLLISGAIQWISAGGDKGAVESARKKVTSALLGIIFLFSVYAIATVVGRFLGINMLVFNTPVATSTPTPVGVITPTATPVCTQQGAACDTTFIPCCGNNVCSTNVSGNNICLAPALPLTCSISASSQNPTAGSSITLTVNARSTGNNLSQVLFYVIAPGEVSPSLIYANTPSSTTNATITINGNSIAATSFLNNMTQGTWTFLCGASTSNTGPSTRQSCGPGSTSCGTNSSQTVIVGFAQSQSWTFTARAICPNGQVDSINSYNIYVHQPFPYMNYSTAAQGVVTLTVQSPTPPQGTATLGLMYAISGVGWAPGGLIPMGTPPHSVMTYLSAPDTTINCNGSPCTTVTWPEGLLPTGSYTIDFRAPAANCP